MLTARGESSIFTPLIALMILMDAPKKQMKRKHASIVEVAEILELDRTTVLGLIKRGHLEGFKITLGVTSPYRVYLDTVQEFIRKRQERK